MTWHLQAGCLHVCKWVIKLGAGDVGNLPIACGNFPLASAYRHWGDMRVAWRGAHLAGYCSEYWSKAKQGTGEASYQVAGHHIPEWEAHWQKDNSGWHKLYSWRAMCVLSFTSAGQALREYLWALRRRMPSSFKLQIPSLTPSPGCLER